MLCLALPSTPRLFFVSFLHICVEQDNMSSVHEASRILLSNLCFVTFCYKSIYHTKHLTLYWDNSLALTNHTICHVTHVSGGTVRCLKYLRLLSIPASTSMILSSSRQSVCFLCISFMMSTCCFKNSLTPNCNIHKIYQEKSLRYKRVVL